MYFSSASESRMAVHFGVEKLIECIKLGFENSKVVILGFLRLVVKINKVLQFKFVLEIKLNKCAKIYTTGVVKLVWKNIA